MNKEKDIYSANVRDDLPGTDGGRGANQNGALKAETALSSPSDSGAGLGQSLGSDLFISSDNVEYEESSYRDCSLSYIPVPFLNLLFFLPLSEAREGSPKEVWNYRVRKEIYDNPKWSHLLSTLEEKLKEIFPHSFLFQLESSQIEYRNDGPRKISLETLDNLYHQILSLDWSRPIEGGTCLARAAHEAWLHTQTRIPHKWLGEIGDDFLAPAEYRSKLTWLMEDGFIFLPNVPSQPSRSDDQIPEKSQPASGAVEPNPKSKRVGIGWTSLFAFIFLSLNLVSSFLIPEKVELLWAISPILPFLYLLLLAGSLYALKDLWLTLWNNLRSGWYNKRFHQYWRKQKDQYL